MEEAGALGLPVETRNSPFWGVFNRGKWRNSWAGNTQGSQAIFGGCGTRFLICSDDDGTDEPCEKRPGADWDRWQQSRKLRWAR